MKKLMSIIGACFFMALAFFMFSPKEANARSGSLQYSLKSDYLVYKIYYVGTGYCPSAADNEGTIGAFWGYPTCR